MRSVEMPRLGLAPYPQVVTTREIDNSPPAALLSSCADSRAGV